MLGDKAGEVGLFLGGGLRGFCGQISGQQPGQRRIGLQQAGQRQTQTLGQGGGKAQGGVQMAMDCQERADF